MQTIGTEEDLNRITPMATQRTRHQHHFQESTILFQKRKMSSFGRGFRVHTFGESHCRGVGCVIDGCPPGLPLAVADIQPQLTRRRPGQSSITTPRNEQDAVEVISGTELGFTLGTPICLLVRNKDHRPVDYANCEQVPRPSHADYAYLQKYGLKASSGGGRSSARETIGRVAAGAVAEHYLRIVFGLEIVAFVSQVGSQFTLTPHQLEALLPHIDRTQVDAHPTRFPDPTQHLPIENYIHHLQQTHDSTGGVVTCVIRNVPRGLGEPCFDKLEATLAQAMLSIPATKGFEFGSGFHGATMLGSQHNDPFTRLPSGQLGTTTNHSGGIQGGISNGQHIYFRVCFKPPATISQPQHTANLNGDPTVLEAKGRHDPCVVPRAVPIVEAMAALCLMDAVMIQMQRGLSTELLHAHRQKLFQHPPDPSAQDTLEKGWRVLTGGMDGLPDRWYMPHE